MRTNSQRTDSALQAATPALISMIVHLVVLVVMALILVKAEDTEALLLTIVATDSQEQDSFSPVSLEPISEPLEDLPHTFADLGSEEYAEPLELAEITLSSSKIADSISASLVTYSMNQVLEEYTGSFADNIRDAQANGIEIVIVFDSTGSMGSEIRAVKARIDEIGKRVLEKIPRARFSLVTYRDFGEQYVAQGISLTNDLVSLKKYVDRVQARGGGDTPEAVHEGMNWAIQNNDFRKNSQKVMLIFGDAPPHYADHGKCRFLAREFASYNKGVIHTVTCQALRPLEQFDEIAHDGHGNAYTLKGSASLMEDLLVLAFGGGHRKEVLDFFEIKQDGPRPKSRSRNRKTRQLVGS